MILHATFGGGAGDSFAAGLIHGFVTGRDGESSFAVCRCGKCAEQTIPGDFNRVSVAEVERLAAGDASGRVQR